MARRSKAHAKAKVFAKRQKAAARRRSHAVDRQIKAREHEEVVDLRDDAYSCPDDSKFRPARRDPLKTGAGRVTGATAKAVSRGKTLTKHEYDELKGTER